MLYKLVGTTKGSLFDKGDSYLYNDGANCIILVDPLNVYKTINKNWRNLYYGVFQFNKTCLIENTIMYPHNYYTFYGSKFSNEGNTKLICEIKQLN